MIGIRVVSIAMLLAVGCAAEPTTDVCAQASATLERCTGQVPEGFREACTAAPDEIATSVLAEVDADRCLESSGKADGLGEYVFVDACVAVVNAAYWIVWARSAKSEPLPKAMRDKLRPWFGNLVDTVRVSWNSGLLTHWRVLGHDVVLEDDTTAQTFGNEIFIRDAQTGDTKQLALIGHELAHGLQYREHGGVSGFAREYCEAFHDAEFSYRQNALEVEAYDLQYRIKACLDHGRDCP